MKGKTGEIAFFEAVDHLSAEYSRFPQAVRTHANALLGAEAGAAHGDPQKDAFWMVGQKRRDLCQRLQTHLVRFFAAAEAASSPGLPQTVLIKGPYGVGKSLLVRNLIQSVSAVSQKIGNCHC